MKVIVDPQFTTSRSTQNQGLLKGLHFFQENKFQENLIHLSTYCRDGLFKFHQAVVPFFAVRPVRSLSTL